jgi:hypothetical protein
MGIFNKDFRQAAAAGGASSTAITLALTVTGATATQSWRKDDVEFSTSASVAVNPVTDGSTYSVVVVPTKNGVLGVAATATDVTFTYQWQYRDDDVAAWNSIGGATSATYVLADFVDERRYQCVVTGTNNRTAGTEPVTNEYTASSTWTKDGKTGLDRIWVLCVSGAGGGGSGRRNASGLGRSGGGGGQGGFGHWQIYKASELAAGNHDVTIGAGGAGGASMTTDNTNGNNGTIGGTTSFSTGATLLSISGGAFGGGGTATTGAGGLGVTPTRTPTLYMGTISGASGGAGNDTGVAVGGGLGMSSYSNGNGLQTSAGAGGGGGGGCAATTNTEIAGAVGGSLYNYDTLVNGPTAGAASAAGTAGTSDQGLKIFANHADNTIGFGTGGSGGGGHNDAVTGVDISGGNGGRAAGGGGGGGWTDGSTGGDNSGGDGGDGFVLIIEYYGA